MTVSKHEIDGDKAGNFILWGIPVIFLVGGLTHFAYEWSGNQAFVGILTPVNESVWEHLKMSFWPGLIWWTVGLILLSRNACTKTGKWIVSAVIALYVCPLFIVSFYYAYTGAFGIKSVVFDIFSLVLGLAASQWLAYHYYKYGKYRTGWLIISVIFLILMMAAFVVFTFLPPHIPLFVDPNTGIYGIR